MELLLPSFEIYFFIGLFWITGILIFVFIIRWALKINRRIALIEKQTALMAQIAIKLGVEPETVEEILKWK